MPCMRYLREMMIQNSFQTYGQRQRWICIRRRSRSTISKNTNTQLPAALLYIVKLVVAVCPQMPIITAPHPDGRAKNVMLNCLRDAGLKQLMLTVSICTVLLHLLEI
jgi:hypothetical protein